MPTFGLDKAIKTAVKAAKVPRGAAALKAAKEAEAAKQAAQMPALQPAPSTVQEAMPASPAPSAVPVASPRVLERGMVQAEAQGVAGARLENYDTEAVHQINFDRITTTDEVKGTIAHLAERVKMPVEEARRGVIGNEAMRGLAADLDLDEDVVRAVLERESGGTLKPEVVLASRQIVNSSAARILDLGKKIANGQATDLDRIALRRQMMFHDEFYTQFMGARAEAGRALNVFNIPVGDELDPAAIARLRTTVDNLHGNDTDELARMLAQMESTQQVSKFASQYTRSKATGVLQEVFLQSILSGPRTHFVNTGGSALFQMMNTAEYGVAAQIGKILPGPEHVEVGEATAMLYGQMTGWRDAMRYAWLAFRNGEGLDDTVRYEGHTRRAISSHNLFPRGAPPSVAAAVDLLGATIRIPTERVMVPVDEFFKTMAYRADLSRQAFLEVNRRLAGGAKLTQEEVQAIVQRTMENPSASAVRKAEDFARYATFQNELGLRGRKWQMAVNSTSGGFVIAPFIRTPINIFKAGLLERSPLAVFSADFRQALAKGGPERDLAVARVAMGSLTVTAVAAATMSGQITGGGPQDPGARRLLESTGWQPYSVVYTDPVSGDTKYQSYARAEPLAYVIGATADAVEMRAYMNADDPLASDDENLNRAVASLIGAVANNTMSKVFMSGVADFSALLDDPSRYAQGWIARTSQAFLPYSAFRRQIGQVQDPLVREAWTYTERLQAGSGWAGYSEGLPPKRDVFGEPVEWRGGSVLGVMSPFPDTTASNDYVAKELIAVMQDTGSIPVTIPSRKIEGMRLTTHEYDELVRYARKEPVFGGVRTFHEELDRLMASSVYLLATPDMKAVLIKQVRENADKAGRIRLEKDNPDFADRLELHRLKKTELLLGETP